MADSEVPGTSRVLLPVAMMALSNVADSVPPSLRSTNNVLASANVCPYPVDLGDLVLLHQEVHAGHPCLGYLSAAVIGVP